MQTVTFTYILVKTVYGLVVTKVSFLVDNPVPRSGGSWRYGKYYIL